MTSSGSAYARFRRALQTGNLTLVRTAAAELPAVSLDDALHVCVLLRDREPDRYERAAVRWIARFCVERVEVSIEDVDQASKAFVLMRSDPERALLALQALCAGA
ncbi:hypothetical protein [Paraconexibacter sp.]|uniref:hypothetical protein n=1 Tax=Paraconexibacter sp. TaxID=2949640 RepID=UPI003568EAA9